MIQTELMLVSIFLISACAGTFGSIVGLGGGVIVVPALTLIFHVPLHYAVGASIISVIGTSSGAAATYVRDHITNIRVAMLLEVATTVGALSGAMLAAYISSRYLYLLFSFIMLYSAVIMLRKRQSDHLPPDESDPLARRLKLPSSYPDAALGTTVYYGVKNVPLSLGLMTGAGIISGLLGIGSGALKVPAMDSAMHLPIKVSSATSNFMIGVTGAASAGAYYMRGEIQPQLAAPVALGVLLGSWLGVRLTARMKGNLIRKIFIGVLLVVAVQMGMKAFA